MKTILVVDDELANAEVLSLILQDEGYRVYCASNGRQALDKVAELRPDLVILDFMMPVMNGAEMGHTLRGAPATSHIPILMNSSLQEDAVREHFTGYDAFLRKPYNIDAVLRLIHELLAGSSRHGKAVT